MANGFIFHKHLLTHVAPTRQRYIIANSQTITVGDAVRLDVGFINACDANERIYGFVTGIKDANGIDLKNTAADNFDGTYTESNGTTRATYVASSDNQTDKKVKVDIIADPYAVVLNTSDATMTTAMVGQFFSLVDEDQVDGDTNSATVGELQLLELDPLAASDNTTGLFRIVAWMGDSFEPET